MRCCRRRCCCCILFTNARSSTIRSLLGALLFSGYVLYDTSVILLQCGE
jgi:FtsH-binding integral membrane protein